MTSFTETSSWQAWVDFCREADSAREEFDPDEANCAITTWGRSLGDITMKEAVEVEHPHYHSGMSFLWFVMNVMDHVPASLREGMLLQVCKDPPIAAMAYRYAHASLSEREKRIVWDAFEGEMPSMRATLLEQIGEPQDG